MGDHSVLRWLLDESEPSVRYFALIDLLDRDESDAETASAHAAMGERGWAADILSSQSPDGGWESTDDLYRPKYTAANWMALMLSDLGLTKRNERVRKTAELILSRWLSGEKNIYGSDVCIVGNTARMLTRFGYFDDQRVGRLFDELMEGQKDDGGWHCWESQTGTLDCWEALAAYAAVPEEKRSNRMRESVKRGAEFYLERNLFREGENRYLPWFRFHYPVHYYYDILVGLDVLSRLGYGHDERMRPALEFLTRKRQKNGIWLLDRIHPDPPSFSWGKGNLRWPIKPFGLEEPGKPSKWITLTALAVLKKAGFPSE